MNTMYNKIKEYVDSNKNEIMALWEKLVNINSGTNNKAGVDKVAEVLAEEMEKAGIVPIIKKEELAGNTIIGEWNIQSEKEPVILMGHIDTVFNKPTEKGFFHIDEDGKKARGNGALDMKGGVVIALYICKAFAAFNFETGNINDGIVVGRLGSELFTIETTGVAAHSGNDPEKGRSAIEEMANKVIKIQALNDIPKGKLVNIGVICTEGKSNIIPGKCFAEKDEVFLDELRPYPFIRAKDDFYSTITLQKFQLESPFL